MTQSNTPILELDHVSKAFGGLKAVDDVSFQVKKGEIIAIIGPNGAGKSTLFEVITGFLIPDKGQVSFREERIDGLKPHQICHRGLTRSFQLVEVFSSFTVYDTILLAALCRLQMAAARQWTREVLESLGFPSKAEHRVSDLSLPDQKMVELGKVLATKPQVVLLDEVMAGLTEGEARKVASTIIRLREEGMTFLVVEHRMEIIMNLCDRMIALNFGKKIAEGTAEQVARDKTVIEAYLGQELARA